MKLQNLLLALPALLLFNTSTAQIKHAHTITVEVDGNCGMCKKTIEAAALVKREARAEWNVDTKVATITYDSTRTDVDAVMKRIALAGYDNAGYLAPADAYAALPGCCQYDRTRKQPVMQEAAPHHPSEMAVQTEEAATAQPQQDKLDPVFSAYFRLKDALVASDPGAATTYAKELNSAVHDIMLYASTPDAHVAWMQEMAPVSAQVAAIASAKDLDAQRAAFAKLTEPLHELLKAAPRNAPVYLAHCPMYADGADWLSLEKPIKNPYYGNKMLTCGSVTQTIVK